MTAGATGGGGGGGGGAEVQVGEAHVHGCHAAGKIFLVFLFLSS